MIFLLLKNLCEIIVIIEAYRLKRRISKIVFRVGFAMDHNSHIIFIMIYCRASAGYTTNHQALRGHPRNSARAILSIYPVTLQVSLQINIE